MRPEPALDGTTPLSETRALPIPGPRPESSAQVLCRPQRLSGGQEAAEAHAERRVLQEQTAALRTERARLQGELAALRAQLAQVGGSGGP